MIFTKGNNRFMAALMVLGLIVLSATGAYASERVVTLEEAIGMALRGNNMLRAAESSLAATGMDVKIARSYYMPGLSVEERYMKTDNPTYAFSSRLGQERFTAADFAVPALNNPEDIEDYQSSIQLRQLLYSRKASVGLSMAHLNLKAEELDLKRKRQSVAFDVTRTYVGVLVAKEYRDISEQAVEDARHHNEVAALRHKNGLGLYSDKLRAEVALKEAQSGLIEADNRYLMAKKTLGLLLGLDEPVDVAEMDLVTPVRELMEFSTDARADIKAMELRVRNADNAVKLASSAYVPTLSIGGSYIFNDHGEAFGQEGDSYMLGVTLSWQLFDGGQGLHERGKARHRRRQAEEMLEGMKREAALRVYEAKLEVASTDKELELAKSRLELATEGHRIVRERYENNLATFIELLDAQTALDAARAGVVHKQGQYVLARRRLMYQYGAVMPEGAPSGGINEDN